ncbi:MAG: hypothetical protein VW500_01040, partial [Aquiluna sp.]
GSKSGATAFVESVITRRIQGRLIDVAFLSNIKGTFLTGELITEDGTLANAPKVIGSLSGFTITNGGQNNTVGDLMNVIDDTGKQGVARVTGIENATGRVDFELVDGGSGYTLNTPDDNNPLNDYTDVRVADAMIFVDNSNTSNQFIQFETVRQDKERIIALSGDDLETSYANTSDGDYMLGVKTYVDSFTGNNSDDTFARSESTDLIEVTLDGVAISNSLYTVTSSQVVFDTPPGNSVAIKLVNYSIVANGVITSVVDSASNTTVDVVVTSGTFGTQLNMDFANDAPLSAGETIYEEQEWNITVDDPSHGFVVSDVLEMRVYTEATTGDTNTLYLSAYANGTVSAQNSTVISLTTAFGTFLDNQEIAVAGDTSSNVTITDVSITNAGAIGVLSSSTDANTWVVKSVTGEFTAGNKIIGQKTRIVEEISAVANVSCSDIWYNGNVSSNGVLDTFSNTSVSGIVVGQNSTCVGLYGNTAAFSFYANSGITIRTSREDLKEHDIVSQPNLVLTIDSVATGQNADFQPGSLENEETVTLNTDLIGGQTVSGVDFMDLTVGGASGQSATNSGIGFVDDITFTGGGSGYSDGASVTFIGGGYAGGEPTIPAEATISVSAGAITDFTVTYPGEGYYTTPTIIVPGGTGATDVTVVMDFGYGFRKNPNGDAATTFENLFTYDQFNMGTITSLTRINPGSNYNADPFVSVHNQYIAGFQRKDILLGITISQGSFSVGETVYQGGVAKGIVKTASATQVTLKRVSFNTSFNTGVNISGATSNAIAAVNSVTTVDDSLAMGENANITAEVIVADGVATGLEIVDSGYGYLHNQSMTLQKTGNPFVITATSKVEQQGIGTGYWGSTNSHLNSEKKLHDNKYYQEYSYDVQTGISLDKYRLLFKELIHVAGTELFGTVVKNSNININTVAATTTVNTVTTS